MHKRFHRLKGIFLHCCMPKPLRGSWEVDQQRRESASGVSPLGDGAPTLTPPHPALIAIARCVRGEIQITSTHRVNHTLLLPTAVMTLRHQLSRIVAIRLISRA